MIDLAFLSSYLVLVVVGICLCVGVVIKQSLDFMPNKYIPLIMALLGIAINIWVAGTFTPEILLGGMFSGLSSTGCYEAFKNLTRGDK
ncbi:MAG: phage holin family protein [Romboutsia timonensis]